jgi:hypothetical protein
MDLLRSGDLHELIEASHGHCVSIYMPSHRAGPETRQDPVRLKNLLGRAEERLMEAGLRRPDARKLLAPAGALMGDGDFWQYQGDGLALFLSSGLRRAYRLPVSFEELVTVNDRFHVKPLLKLLTGDGRFMVLALSQNQIRLLQGRRQTVSEVELEEVPQSLADVAVHREMRVVQWHTGAAPTGGGGGGRRAAVFHGHGPEEDQEVIRKYLRSIDEGLRQAVPDERSPLVLAGVDSLLDLYRQVTSYPNVLPDAVSGNPDALRPHELHDRAWAVVEPHFRKEMEAAAERYREMAGTGLAVPGVAEVVPPAVHGRVETLWVAVGIQRWGRYVQDRNEVEVRDRPGPGDHDLLDLAAVQTLVNSGTVYAVDPGEIPADAPAAALLRY